MNNELGQLAQIGNAIEARLARIEAAIVELASRQGPQQPGATQCSEAGQRNPISPWMTAREAAEYLRCSVPEIHRRFAEGLLKRHYDGTRLLVLRSEIEVCVQAASEPKRKRGRPISRREPVVLTLNSDQHSQRLS
jgi:hypothetical protein